MRRLLFVLACVLSGCGPEFAVIPNGGAPEVTARAPFGVTLTAFANQWEGDPYDLADYVTPIAVEIQNSSNDPIRICYADFALRDEKGTRYQAVNPFVPAALGSLEEPAGEKPVLLAARGVVVGAPHVGRASGGAHFLHFRGYGTRGIVVGAPFGRRHGGYWAGAPYGGFRFYGGLRGFYGPGVLYWGGPLFYPPWYDDWVIGWGAVFYAWPRPSYDVLSNGLPEGVLEPGAQVSGFLYFKRATRPDVHRLDLGWEMYDARTGRALGSDHVPLRVVAR